MGRAIDRIGHLRLRLCTQLGRSRRGESASVAHARVRSLRRESAIRTRWHVAVRSALSKRMKRRDVVDGVIACLATRGGRIHTTASDQSRGWCAPPMVEEAYTGSYSPGPAAPASCFRPTTRLSGANDDAATGSNDDVTDLISDPTGPHDSPTRMAAAISTAKCLQGGFEINDGHIRRA